MKKYYIFLFLSVFFLPTFSQTLSTTGLKYAETITAEDLKSHLEIIASDSFGGRDAGRVGQKMAMEYLINTFKEMGIKAVGDTTYIQEFPLVEQVNSGIAIRSNGKEFTGFEDFYIFNHYFKDTTISTNAFFASYGLEDDYAEVSVNNNVAVIYGAIPSNDSSVWDVRQRIDCAGKKGAAAVLVITDGFETNLIKYDRNLSRKRMWLNTEEIQNNFPVFYISTSASERLFPDLSLQKFRKKGKAKNIEAQEITIEFKKPTENFISENVLAYLPGSDLKDELVAITAHYDHIGKNDSLIFNGADDNGSGTVALLEIAEAFMKAKKEGNGPRRSILVLLVSAEEKGLLGSRYYSDNPVFPLENTVANLNVDMIGRIDEKHDGNPDYIYLIGSDRLSQDLHDISENVAHSYFNIELDYTYNAPDDPNRFYYRSDHYNFAKHNIPAIFYFSGVHEDYHKSTDTIEKILFDKVEKISRLIFMTAWEIANRDERPQLNKDVLE